MFSLRASTVSIGLLIWLILAACTPSETAVQTPDPSSSAITAANTPQSQHMPLDQGIGWLLEQQDINGGFGSPPSARATASALAVLGALRHEGAEIDYQALSQGLAYLQGNLHPWPDRESSGELGRALIGLSLGQANLTDPETVELISSLNALHNPATGLYHPESLFRHALAVLALGMAEIPLPENVLAPFIHLQQPDGGWTWRIGSDGRPAGISDVDTTALVLKTLAAGGVGSDDTVIQNGLTFLADHQSTDGGWALDVNGPPNANSTGLVLQTLAALGLIQPQIQKIDAGKAQRWLQSLQQPEGWFMYTPEIKGATLLATSDALPALLYDFQPQKETKQ